MQLAPFGNTGLVVSRVGLGCGGPSRLGQAYGQPAALSKRVVFRALELGINLFDTAESYGTEAILGEALREAGRLQDVVISTKKQVWDTACGGYVTPRAMREGIDASLTRLGRERIEIFHLHGLDAAHLDYALAEIVPVLVRAREDGKIGHIAVSEGFMTDTAHRMLERAVELGAFEVMMVGFNLLNPSARRRVLPAARRLGIGVLLMFAVRRALTNPARLEEVLAALAERGEVDPAELGSPPLGFLGDLRDAAYRFCAHEPGADVVLTGTGNPEHLEDNVKSLCAPPLSPPERERLERLFGAVSSVSAH
jgi:aryl-alcohol dehydrogenase-like predicted oxidoreductase